MALSEAAKKIGDMPAFPLIVSDTDAEACEVHRGLTKREWLIGQAMCRVDWHDEYDDLDLPGSAECAGEMADAILEHLAAEAAALKPE